MEILYESWEIVEILRLIKFLVLEFFDFFWISIFLGFIFYFMLLLLYDNDDDEEEDNDDDDFLLLLLFVLFFLYINLM